jgi:predicted Zn-dependent protease
MRSVLEGNSLLVVISILLLIHSCSRNNITGRFQVALLPEGELRAMATQEYRQFLGQHRILPHNGNPKAWMVRKVGQKLTKAINDLYSRDPVTRNILSNYRWEYSVVESPEVNAWCLPGGKIVVYSGLLEVTGNEAALAVVMGHEIAHALARHGNERMSYSMLAGGIGIVGKILTSVDARSRMILENVYDEASRLHFLLPKLREQEIEADKLGLIYTAAAGYDPGEAIPLWRRMHKATSGFTPPEFQSTHPSEESRIRELRSFMPQALKYLNRTDR